MVHFERKLMRMRFYRLEFNAAVWETYSIEMLRTYVVLKLLLSGTLLLLKMLQKNGQPATAAMHGPHNVFDIGHCTVIHCDAGGVSLVDQWNAEKI